MDIAMRVLKTPPPQLRFDEDDFSRPPKGEQAPLGLSMRVPTLNRILTQDPALNIEQQNALGFRQQGPRGGLNWQSKKPYVGIKTDRPMTSDTLAEARKQGFTILPSNVFPGSRSRDYQIKPRNEEQWNLTIPRVPHSFFRPDEGRWYGPAPEYSENTAEEEAALFGDWSEEEKAASKANEEAYQNYQKNASEPMDIAWRLLKGE